jgi:hypothetical protein
VIERAAAQIAQAFPAERGKATDHPCHRLVLDLSNASESKQGIPDDARVVEGKGATETYTLSLFQVATGVHTHTWGELVAALGSSDAPWRRQLDQRFAAALRGELFAPTTATLRAFALEPRHRRHYRPIIYEVLRAQPPNGARVTAADRPALAVTILLDPQVAPTLVTGSALHLVRIHARFAAEVFDVFNRTVETRRSSGRDVFTDVREAFQIIDEEAERYGAFELGELKHIFGDSYKRCAIEELTHDWNAGLRRLDTALAAQDATAVEGVLDEMRELNHRFSLAATRRYLATLETG